VADPENSAFHRYYESGDAAICLPHGSGIEGIGRPRVEPSFLPEVIDRMEAVPNAHSIAAIYFLEELLGRRVGVSTGTNFVAVCRLLAELQASGAEGSVVTLLCDSGELYRDTYYSSDWLAAHGYDLAEPLQALERFWEGGA
jgi:cysteine synthase